MENSQTESGKSKTIEDVQEQTEKLQTMDDLREELGNSKTIENLQEEKEHFRSMENLHEEMMESDESEPPDFLPLETVRKAVNHQIVKLDPDSIEEVIQSILPRLTSDEAGPMRQAVIDAFQTNLNKKTLEHIRNLLLQKYEAERFKRMSLSDKVRFVCGDEISVEVTDSQPSSSLSDRDSIVDELRPLLDEHLDDRMKLEYDHIASSLYDEEESERGSHRDWVKGEEEAEYRPSVSSRPSFNLPPPCSSSTLSSTGSIQYPLLDSGRYQCAVAYLYQKRLDRLFQFLLAHLLKDLPCNPVQYMVDTIDALISCRKFRGGDVQPLGGEPKLPARLLLFDKEDVDALYDCMDPSRLGYISKKQYRTGMKTLGITNINRHPQEVEGKGVPYDVFKADARLYFRKMLFEEIICPTW